MDDLAVAGFQPDPIIIAGLDFNLNFLENSAARKGCVWSVGMLVDSGDGNRWRKLPRDPSSKIQWKPGVQRQSAANTWFIPIPLDDLKRQGKVRMPVDLNFSFAVGFKRDRHGSRFS